MADVPVFRHERVAGGFFSSCGKSAAVGRSFGIAAGFQPAIRVCPQQPCGDRCGCGAEKISQLLGAWDTRRVDIPNSRTQPANEVVGVDVLKQLHPGTRGLNRGDVCIQAEDRLKDLTKL